MGFRGGFGLWASAAAGRLWRDKLGFGPKARHTGTVRQPAERTYDPRAKDSGFVPARCSTYALMPWGKGATPREPTVEKPCKQKGMVNVAPDIAGARSVAHESHESHE